jgi:predicted amidohydrolase
MKAGFLQMEPKLGQGPQNALRARELIGDADKMDLIVLPELANSGYNFKNPKTAMEYSEDVERSHFIDILQKVCADKNCHIVTGFNERDGDKIYNSALLINEKGVVGKYRKIHLFMNEKDYFTPGDEPPKVFEILGWRIGIAVCFDWAFPELWRSLGLKGADIVAHPANFILEEYAKNAVPIHAMLNRYYVITANRIGIEDDLTFTGGSFIADPTGTVIAKARKKSEEVRIVELFLDECRNKKITPRNDLFADRRPSLYI